jgi:hypothetical protein
MNCFREELDGNTELDRINRIYWIRGRKSEVSSQWEGVPLQILLIR